jgi:hypothetical protein
MGFFNHALDRRMPLPKRPITPKTATMTYAYNADGTLQSKTDAKG